MDDRILLTRTAFFALLDIIGGLPNPDDPGDPNNPFGPYGPIGPVLSELAWVLLNPQPLPPRWAQEYMVSTLRRFGPQPDRWRARTAVHQIVNEGMMQLQLAEVVAGSDAQERSIIVVGGRIREIVDDWCGTGPHRWPWPKPRRGNSDEGVDALDLLIAGREFQRLADTLSENPLQNEFATAAAQLFDVGLSKLNQ